MRLRRRTRRSVIFGVIAVAYLAGMYLFVRANWTDDSDLIATPGSGSASSDLSSAAALGGSPSVGAGSPTPSASAGRGGTTSVLSPLPQTTITVPEPGGIVIKSPSEHSVVLTVTSSQRVPRLGFLVPTSADHSSGDMRNVAAPWSLRTVAYGKPAYAEIFVQAGKSGAAITCTIRVDGAVTSTRTTSGAFGRQVCIG